MKMKMRRGWKVVWSDGTEWPGDCPEWAAQPLPPGARLVTVRILGTGRQACTGCTLGRH